MSHDPEVTNRSRPAYEAEHLVDRQLAEIGIELRKARITSGKTQAECGRAIGLSGSQVSRIENRKVPLVAYRTLGRFASCVGLRLSAKTFPIIRRPFDAPQLALYRRLRARAHPSWRWQTEVPLPIPGDLRAADATCAVPGCLVIWELWTRLGDFQAQARAALVKKRELGADCLIIVLLAGRANRAAVRAAEPAITDAFPLGTRAVLSALAAGRCPAGDGLVLL